MLCVCGSIYPRGDARARAGPHSTYLQGMPGSRDASKRSKRASNVVTTPDPIYARHTGQGKLGCVQSRGSRGGGLGPGGPARPSAAAPTAHPSVAPRTAALGDAAAPTVQLPPPRGDADGGGDGGIYGRQDSPDPTAITATVNVDTSAVNVGIKFTNLQI